ncbi:hypothetical protein SRABI96_00683 [Peribacillus sp. Bi96]|nr:hypothetical protein SRABI96_00683 [Peribacillus sp. Bi96]
MELQVNLNRWISYKGCNGCIAKVEADKLDVKWEKNLQKLKSWESVNESF